VSERGSVRNHGESSRFRKGLQVGRFDDLDLGRPSPTHPEQEHNLLKNAV
jgi:hypothetical protein